MDILYSLYLTLLFPAVIYLIPEPHAYKWARGHGSVLAMPAELWIKAASNGRYVLLIKECLLLIILGASSLSSIVRLWKQASGMWHTAVVVGSLFGILLGMAGSLVSDQAIARRPSRLEHGYGYGLGPMAFWLSFICLAGLIEESWRALAIEAILVSGFQGALAVFATSLAFTIAYLGGIPARISERTMWWTLLWSAGLSLLFIVSRNVLLTSLGNIAANETFLIAQRKKRPTPHAAE